MKLKYKHLIPTLPKYVRKYKERKAGDVLESRVIVCDSRRRYSANDPVLLEKEVLSMMPYALNKYFNWKGYILVEIKG